MPHTIIQLTDCHLFADKGATLRDVATWPRFEKALDDIRRRTPNFDALVISGDTAHDERPETYELAREALGEMVDRLFIIPGNHDNRDALRERFVNCQSLLPNRTMFEWMSDDWRMIGLDSQLTGEVRGELGQQQLDWLDEQLATRPTPTVVWMHHPPVSVRSGWLDEIGLTDAAAFNSIVARHAHVRLVITGHVHQDSTSALNGAIALTTPAVGLPFRPRADQLIIDPDPPSYRIVELGESSCWTSQVLRCCD
ncbi:MAG: phosphodiesterase [Pirellulaceae bacterium]|jgi:Icc protein|nr:phosphodiesterase [Pirellulaceae bacterium]MDP7016482.1 phosphodiesterase [Pirellulaceae bacterium]